MTIGRNGAADRRTFALRVDAKSRRGDPARYMKSRSGDKFRGNKQR